MAAVAKLTKTIPIVAIAGDLVAEGLVASLAKPGGTITGLRLLQPDMAAKRLGLLKESLPGLTRVGLLFGPVGQWLYETAKALGLTIPRSVVLRAVEVTE